MTDNTTEQASFEPVGQAWSDATLVTQRWGPAALSCTRADVSFSEGDSAIATMGSGELHNLWTYTLIDPMERIEFYSRFCDADGNPVKPADLGMPAEIPEGLPHVVTLQGDGEATVLTVWGFGSVGTRSSTCRKSARSSARTSSPTSLRSSEG